ncbi:hypothetical protein AGLY_013594 [Aphis glycines]|uniref:Uncharacterized protein n=1 Tax=Aphis glycines TaxID=307491 RepID=A0A6G0T7D6_APHGL|nr:hypothetical protein AGLY_013594 [Aphis glycines]
MFILLLVLWLPLICAFHTKGYLQSTRYFARRYFARKYENWSGEKKATQDVYSCNLFAAMDNNNILKLINELLKYYWESWGVSNGKVNIIGALYSSNVYEICRKRKNVQFRLNFFGGVEILEKFNFDIVHNRGGLGTYQPGKFENLTALIFFNRQTSYYNLLLTSNCLQTLVLIYEYLTELTIRPQPRIKKKTSYDLRENSLNIVISILDSERSEECINFTMRCVYFFYLGMVFGGKWNILGPRCIIVIKIPIVIFIYLESALRSAQLCLSIKFFNFGSIEIVAVAVALTSLIFLYFRSGSSSSSSSSSSSLCAGPKNDVIVVQLVYIDNNYYQTVAFAGAFEETLVLPWSVCSPQLTTNSRGEKEKHNNNNNNNEIQDKSGDERQRN